MWANPAVTQFIGGRPFTAEETWARFLRYIGHWSVLGFGYWMVEERASRSFAGEVGFADFRREITPSIDGIPELGWALAPCFHGRGYATEAVRAAQGWGEANLQSRRSVCLIHPENLPSLRVANKCGFREWTRATYKNQPTIILTRE